MPASGDLPPLRLPHDSPGDLQAREDDLDSTSYRTQQQQMYCQSQNPQETPNTHTIPTPFSPNLKVFSVEEWKRQRNERVAVRGSDEHNSTPTDGYIPLDKSRTGENVQALNHLCNLRGLTKHFEFPSMRGGFAGVLQLSFPKDDDDDAEANAQHNDKNTTITAPGPHRNKKDAKDAVAQKACSIASAWPETPKARRKHGSENGGGGGAAAHDEVGPHDENWIGILQEYTQKTGALLPAYQHYNQPKPPYLFACTCTLPSQRPDSPFGGPREGRRGFRSKQAAKMAAAREAVAWLRASGMMAADGMKAAKKRKGNATGGGDENRNTSDQASSEAGGDDTAGSNNNDLSFSQQAAGMLLNLSSVYGLINKPRSGNSPRLPATLLPHHALVQQPLLPMERRRILHRYHTGQRG